MKNKMKNKPQKPPKKTTTEMRSVAVVLHLIVGAMNNNRKAVHTDSFYPEIALLSGYKEQNKCTDI
jgi:hypothetical protein